MVKLKNKKKYDWQSIYYLAPAICLILIFSYYPPIVTLLHSFTKWNGVSSEFIWFDNFKEIFNDPIFWKGVKNQIILLVLGITVVTFATLLLTELIYNCRSVVMSKFYKFTFILPMLVPGIVVMLLWTQIILSPEPNGLANSILRLIGLNEQTWFWGESTALLSLVINGFPYMGGTGFLIYLAGLQNIPVEALEASEMDGITTMKRIWYIDIPLIASQIKFGLILGIISNLQGFGMQLMVTKGGPNYSTTVPAYYMYSAAFTSGKFGKASAVGLIMFVVILILTIINNKFLKTTEEATEK